MAKLYSEGSYIPKDLNTALLYAERAAVCGDASCQTLIGWHQYKRYKKEDIEDALDEAEYWLKCSALQNDRRAQRLLSDIYSKKKEETLELYWLTNSVALGDRVSEFLLGLKLSKQKNYQEAIPLVRSSARKGLTQAQYLLGVLLLSDDTGETLNEALLWLAEAARKGHAEAKIRYEKLFEDLSDDEVNDFFGKIESGENLIGPVHEQEKPLKLSERLYKTSGNDWDLSGGDGSGLNSAITVESYPKSFEDFQVEFLHDLYQMMAVGYEIIQSDIDAEHYGYVVSRIKPIRNISREFIDIRFFDFSKLARKRLNQTDSRAKDLLQERVYISMADEQAWTCHQIFNGKFHFCLESWQSEPNRPRPVSIEIEDMSELIQGDELNCPLSDNNELISKIQKNFASYIERLGCSVAVDGHFHQQEVAGNDALVAKHDLVDSKTTQYLHSYAIVIRNQNCLYGVRFVIDCLYQDELLESVANAVESIIFVDSDRAKSNSNHERELQALVASHLNVFYEIEALDTQFRYRLNAEERREKSPWIMLGRGELQTEELEVWRELDRGVIADAQAIEKFSKLMERYYAHNS